MNWRLGLAIFVTSFVIGLIIGLLMRNVYLHI